MKRKTAEFQSRSYYYHMDITMKYKVYTAINLDEDDSSCGPLPSKNNHIANAKI